MKKQLVKLVVALLLKIVSLSSIVVLSAIFFKVKWQYFLVVFCLWLNTFGEIMIQDLLIDEEYDK